MPDLTVGKEYTSSVWVFAEQVSTLRIGIEDSDNYIYSIKEDEVGKWVRVHILQKPTSTSSSFICLAIPTGAYQKVAFRMAQLEEGNKETTWGPSFNDLQNMFVSRTEFDTVNTTLDQINGEVI